MAALPQLLTLPLLLLVVLLALSFEVTEAAGKLECLGGPRAACECLLNCNVFGHDKEQCDSAADPNTVVNQAVYKALQKPGKECDGIKCVVHCAAHLKCLDDAVQERCAHVKENSEQCDVTCDGSFAYRSASALGVAPLAALLLFFHQFLSTQ